VAEHVLVLGAGGFIGQHLLAALAKNGQAVIAVGRRPFPVVAECIEPVVADLREPADFLPLLARARAVVHLASLSTPGSSAGRPLAELDGNLRPTLALLEALQQHPLCHLLYVSSGGTLYGDTHGAPATERDRAWPKSYYGAGKAAAENFIAAWCSQCASSATIVRPSNVYGPGQTGHHGFAIIPHAMGRMLRDESLTIWGDGSAERDYLYIDDFVDLCLRILAAPRPGSTLALNAASGIDTRLNALLDQLELAAGRPLQRSYAPGRSVDVARIALDPALAQRLLGWTASTSLQEGLRRTWAWFSTTRP